MNYFKAFGEWTLQASGLNYNFLIFSSHTFRPWNFNQAFLNKYGNFWYKVCTRKVILLYKTENMPGLELLPSKPNSQPCFMCAKKQTATTLDHFCPL